MNAGETLLHHARTDARVRALSGELQHLEAALAGDARLEAAHARLAEVRAAQQEAALRVRDRERDVEQHRTRLRDRDRELMSGRIHNPTELTKLSAEVDHLRERLGAEEDAELELMEELERRDDELRVAERELARRQEEFDAAAPQLRSQLEAAQQQLAEAEAERAAAWAAVPPEYQAAAARVRAQPPVAETSGGQCGACHVSLTSGATQRLRRGELVNCDNCGRVLVMG